MTLYMVKSVTLYTEKCDSVYGKEVCVTAYGKVCDSVYQYIQTISIYTVKNDFGGCICRTWSMECSISNVIKRHVYSSNGSKRPF